MNSSNDMTSMEQGRRLAPLGRGLFGAGIALLVLRGLEFATRMPGLPAFWYTNQPLWIVLGLFLIGLGWQILWRMPQSSVRMWRPSVPGRRFRVANLFVSEGCHLCDEALDRLADYQRWLPPIQEVDIQTDPELLERFKTCVPVLELDGKVRFRGRIDTTLLRRLIEGTPPLW